VIKAGVIKAGVIKVLVVDDSALMRRLVGEILATQPDMQAAFARDGEEALRQVRLLRPDVVTLDVTMPGLDGLEVLDRLMVEYPCPVVMVSSLTSAGAEATLEALQRGAVDVVAKPTGALSLGIDELRPMLLEKIRTAAGARPRRARGLVERIRLRAVAPSRRVPPPVVTPGGRSPAAAPLQGAEPAGIVLVGASTGGPPALDAVLSRLPAGFPWAVLVAQHMPAAFTGPLARRLDRLCALRVTEVTGPTPLVAGCVYIAAGDADMIVTRRGGSGGGGPLAQSAPASAVHRWHPSVDRLVGTAMQHLDAARLLGVLLTGMGDDGAAAMAALRSGGGHTIAEAESTAVVWGMPGALVRAGGAEAVAPLDEIVTTLLDWLA
jgi:two-component system, chemotaxis family, protein-glutamate methylesterase/glutaminase